jgi:glyoxylase-like metal-dependent hydrolase (beta-lactamase superfamily II)
MNIKLFELNPFRINSYLYFDEISGEGILIDPAVSDIDEENLISDYIQNKKIKIKYIINTHGHIDHVMGNKWAKEKFSVPILIHENDVKLLSKAVEQGLLFGIKLSTQPAADKYMADGDIISFKNCSLQVVHTPGHSEGSVCLIDEINKIIFSGDTLFRNSIGRTDLPGGDMDTLLNSIVNKVLCFPDDFAVYPGHLESTTIGEEKLGNPFLSGDFGI